MKRIFLYIFLLLPFYVSAQNGIASLAGAKGAAMGNASVAFTGIESAYSNQAGLTELKSFAINLTAQNRFLLSELNTFYLAAAYPTRLGVFGLTVQHYGYEAYNEQKIGLSYARKLFEGLAISAQFDYLNTQIAEFGNNGIFTFELGLYSKPFKKLAFAAHLFSPARISISEEDEVPTILKLGLAYTASKKILITAEVEKDIDFPVRFKTGMEYQLANSFYLRFGVSTEPVQIGFGVGYRFQNMRIDAASQYHQVLGASPAFSFSYLKE